MKRKKRILTFTDAHFSVDTKIEEARWWPPAERILPEKIANKYLQRIDSLTQECFYEMLSQASKLKPFDCIIGFGDGTPGTNQRGIITDKAMKERLRYREIIDEFFPKTEKRFLWGNHDTGFYSKSTSIFSLGSQIGYMDKKSYNLAEKIIGPPWGSFRLDNFVFLLLNSEIIRASRRKKPVLPDRSFFNGQEKEQERFVEDVLNSSTDQVILAIHNPSKLKFLSSVLEKHKDRICLTLAGHYHILFSRREKEREIRRELPWIKLEIIPNTWGGISENNRLFGGKGGFAVLEPSNSSCKPEYHWL